MRSSQLESWWDCACRMRRRRLLYRPPTWNAVRSSHVFRLNCSAAFTLTPRSDAQCKSLFFPIDEIFYYFHSQLTSSRFINSNCSQRDTSNLKLGRRGKTNELTVSTRDLTWSHWRLSQYLMCKHVKCYSFIMKSQISFEVRETGVFLAKINCLIFTILSPTGRYFWSFGIEPSNQRRWASFKFVLCSNSAKSRSLMPKESTRRISTCRQFLIIEEVSSVVLVISVTNVTSFGRVPMLVLMWRCFNFSRRTISLCKSFGCSVKDTFSAWIFEQKEIIHLMNSVNYKWSFF